MSGPVSQAVIEEIPQGEPGTLPAQSSMPLVVTKPDREDRGGEFWTHYQPERVANILKLIEEGLSITGVCKGVGIARETFRLWREKRPEFKRAVDLAEQKYEAFLLKAVHVGLGKEPKLALALLERRQKEDYAPSVNGKVEHSHLHGLITGEVMEALIQGRNGQPKLSNIQPLLVEASPSTPSEGNGQQLGKK